MDVTARDVPKYSQAIFGPRTSRYVVGVPVINEGERIQRQVQAMQSLASEVDVVIADGGSDDGSLDETFLSGLGIRALLTKTDEGRLGAQLRMLFAWALNEGYDGVISIDGNGKDGLEGITHVREALERGFDFVQGSRFIAGGIERNTPLDRKVAVRWLHAPVMSLASRFRYTDTTNGLRGWSRRFLEDPRVAVFRKVFEGYELHYYLAVRAARLGFRVTEVPARREYPAGRAPSKIHGLRSRVQLVRLLFAVATGRFNPRAR